MNPTPARMVLYTLRDGDVQLINEQRAAVYAEARSRSAAFRAVGNDVAVGQVYPAVVVRVFDGAEGGECNLTVLLDGADTFWACSRKPADVPTPGCWHWPPRV